jgi:hypothetical protein
VETGGDLISRATWSWSDTMVRPPPSVVDRLRLVQGTLSLDCWQVRFCIFMGYRRVITAASPPIDAKVLEVAAEQADDGRPKLEFLYVESAVDMLPLCWE